MNPPSKMSTGKASDARPRTPPLSRRKFLTRTTTTAAALTVVPRHVLGGPGVVPPSEKLTIAMIGCGTQALRELPSLLATPEVQVVAACDPVKEGHNYVDWSKDGLRSEIAQSLGNPEWRRGEPGIPGGRDVLKEVVELTYVKQRSASKFNGCACYADFRELLEKQSDITTVKIMTPDHLHATVAIAAMKKGKQVLVHKPLANRLHEARLVIETARKTGVATHFLPASDGARIKTIKAWIDQGMIGKLREIHNWSNRPVWPQFAKIPTDTPPVPEGFDWTLWLGPSLDRPYHPNYTHAVFRGWYEFGGGALADMGHYSLWPVFTEFDLDAPVCVESHPAHLCALTGNVSGRIKNDYSFPPACTIRFKFAAKGHRPPLELFWYDGSMKPPTPEELDHENQELAAEGMMFVGDKGKILAEFRGENPRVLGKQSRPAEREESASSRGAQREALRSWTAAFKAGKSTWGDFRLAGPISEAFNLAAVSLRMGGKRLLYDATTAQITNVPEANKYLTREYRKGWELS